MVKFSIGEYIRNIGYNIVSVLLLAVTFIACTIFLSNISAQQRMNSFLEPYLNKNSIIIAQLSPYFDVTELTKYEKAIMTREIFCASEDVNELNTCLLYSDYSMDKLTPRLKEGSLINDTYSKDSLMQVLISENEAGVGEGDIINLEFYDYEGGTFDVPARVTGVVASGQKLLFGNGVRIGKTMESSDIFGTYSYEQLGYALVITTEKEFAKIPKPTPEVNFRCIIKFEDSITEEERQANFQKVMDFEYENGTYTTEAFPEISTMVEQQQEEMRTLMIKYVPLTIAVFVLLGVCIICMVSIKNANSMRYYATLYICGMPYRNAVLMSGLEMFLNSILAVFLAVSFVVLQNKFLILGEINCSLDSIQMGLIMFICVTIVMCTMILTGSTLKERSPMNVLRDTAY